MKTINTAENQTIVDIAIQEYGNRLAIFDIIEDNPTIFNESGSVFSITNTLGTGQELSIKTEGDRVKQKVTRNIPNKVTSYRTEVLGGETDNYLATEDNTYILTSDGQKILIL